ncbi:MAG: hypothetical protein KDD38_10580, partial [Bdellovibrionales bacterium]|nr:hypothetical protein [Bdellovibrionales bacterium]
HGASFDASTGEFTWSPPVGTAVGIEPKAKTLHVTIVLETKPIYAVTKDVSIFVIRKTQAPVIETVENLPDKQIVYEGRTHSFNVKVRMPAQDEMPTLIAPATVTGTGNASGLVSFVRLQPVVSPQDPTLWVFSMRLQTQDIDLTDSKMSMEFGLQAFSPYGEASAIVEKEFMLYTSLMKPMITWRTDGRFTTDQLNKVEFMIFDPRSEGKLDIQNNCLNVLGAGASCYCVGSDSAKNCAVEWMPDATKGSRTYTIEFRAKNESPNARDSRFSEEVFRKKIFVETKIATEVAK